jgi:hypothetical protein
MLSTNQAFPKYRRPQITELEHYHGPSSPRYGDLFTGCEQLFSMEACFWNYDGFFVVVRIVEGLKKAARMAA